MRIQPDVAAEFAARRHAELRGSAAACRAARAARRSPGRPAVLATARQRLGWWLIGRGLGLIGGTGS
jgi:hypothetical protein